MLSFNDHNTDRKSKVSTQKTDAILREARPLFCVGIGGGLSAAYYIVLPEGKGNKSHFNKEPDPL